MCVPAETVPDPPMNSRWHHSATDAADGAGGPTVVELDQDPPAPPANAPVHAVPKASYPLNPAAVTVAAPVDNSQHQQQAAFQQPNPWQDPYQQEQQQRRWQEGHYQQSHEEMQERYQSHAQAQQYAKQQQQQQYHRQSGQGSTAVAGPQQQQQQQPPGQWTTYHPLQPRPLGPLRNNTGMQQPYPAFGAQGAPGHDGQAPQWRGKHTNQPFGKHTAISTTV